MKKHVLHWLLVHFGIFQSPICKAKKLWFNYSFADLHLLTALLRSLPLYSTIFMFYWYYFIYYISSIYIMFHPSNLWTYIKLSITFTIPTNLYKYYRRSKPKQSVSFKTITLTLQVDARSIKFKNSPKM